MIELPELPVPVVAPSTLVTTASGTFGPLFTADQMRAFARQAVAAESEQFRRLVLDDALAMTFQTMGQYRSALAKAMGAEIEKEEAK